MKSFIDIVGAISLESLSPVKRKRQWTTDDNWSSGSDWFQTPTIHPSIYFRISTTPTPPPHQLILRLSILIVSRLLSIFPILPIYIVTLYFNQCLFFLLFVRLPIRVSVFSCFV